MLEANPGRDMAIQQFVPNVRLPGLVLLLREVLMPDLIGRIRARLDKKTLRLFQLGKGVQR